MAAINHGGTFYRLIKVRSLVTAAKQTSWPCILRASKSCRSHSQLKAFRSAIASLKLKRKANCIRAGSFSPFPSCHASGTPGGSSTASTHNPYKEVILSRRPFNEGVKGCTRPPQPRYGLAVLPMILLSRTNARPSERDLNNRFSCNLTERRLL